MQDVSDSEAKTEADLRATGAGGCSSSASLVFSVNFGNQCDIAGERSRAPDALEKTSKHCENIERETWLEGVGDSVS